MLDSGGAAKSPEGGVPESPEAKQLLDASKIETLGGGDSTAAVVGVLALTALSAVIAPLYLPISTLAAIATLMVVFVAVSRCIYSRCSACCRVLRAVKTRHFTLIRGRADGVGRAWAAARDDVLSPDTSELPAVYFAYVLGSGGHTGELCEIIKQHFRAGRNLHRRYVISSGDTHSINAVARLEGLVQTAFSDGAAGTWDVFRVSRARRVHQPLWTAPYSSLLSALSVVQALIQAPRERALRGGRSPFAFPNLIVTNGPGTGFIVCLVAHLLKIFFLVPNNRLKIVYIETWAHLTTLSLTGKLFHYSDIADLFMVQHRSLAERTGRRFVGDIAPNGNLLGVRG